MIGAVCFINRAVVRYFDVGNRRGLFCVLKTFLRNATEMGFSF